MVISFPCLASTTTKLTWILPVPLLFVLATITRVHGQSGFISVDCRLTNSSAYIDSSTGIQFDPDAGFVEGGLSHNISAEFMGDSDEQQKTLTSFPDGSRNCYTLPSITGIWFDPDAGFVDGGLSNKISAEFLAGSDEPQKTLRSFPNDSRNCYTLPSITGKKYLLRATFTYGNYDGLNKSQDGSLFLFGLHIGVNFWEAVNFTNWGSAIWKEVLTVAPSNNILVCLINFGSGTPFMSALELRPLQDEMYPFVNTSVSISYFSRIRFGNATEFIRR